MVGVKPGGSDLTSLLWDRWLLRGEHGLEGVSESRLTSEKVNAVIQRVMTVTQNPHHKLWTEFESRVDRIC